MKALSHPIGPVLMSQRQPPWDFTTLTDYQWRPSSPGALLTFRTASTLLFSSPPQHFYHPLLINSICTNNSQQHQRGQPIHGIPTDCKYSDSTRATPLSMRACVVIRRGSSSRRGPRPPGFPRVLTKHEILKPFYSSRSSLPAHHPLINVPY